MLFKAHTVCIHLCIRICICAHGAYYMHAVFIVVLLLHSAGVGRTGSFIAIDAMMQRLKEKDDLDIYDFVTQMRTKRTYMVQNLVRRQTMLMFPGLYGSVGVVVA